MYRKLNNVLSMVACIAKQNKITMESSSFTLIKFSFKLWLAKKILVPHTMKCEIKVAIAAPITPILGIKSTFSIVFDIAPYRVLCEIIAVFLAALNIPPI